MSKPTGPSNANLRALINDLKILSSQQKVNIWKSVAQELEKPTRRRRSVNLSKIDRYAKDNEMILIPGKVLGTGSLTKNVSVAAFQFSVSAKNKIRNSMNLRDLMSANPKGKNIRIIG